MKRSKGKINYPTRPTGKTFQIKYHKKLSSVAKLILNSFNKKYLYYLGS